VIIEHSSLCNKKLIPYDLYLSAAHKFAVNCFITSKVQRCLLGIKFYNNSIVLNKLQKEGQARVLGICVDEQGLGLLEAWFLAIVELALTPECWLSKKYHFREGE